MLREQVARLARLAQDIALVTAAGEGRLSMHWQSVQVGALVDDAVAQAGARFADTGVELTVEATDAARRTVRSEERRVGEEGGRRGARRQEGNIGVEETGEAEETSNR